jgi:hypothetical protein
VDSVVGALLVVGICAAAALYFHRQRQQRAVVGLGGGKRSLLASGDREFTGCSGASGSTSTSTTSGSAAAQLARDSPNAGDEVHQSSGSRRLPATTARLNTPAAAAAPVPAFDVETGAPLNEAARRLREGEKKQAEQSWAAGVGGKAGVVQLEYRYRFGC